MSLDRKVDLSMGTKKVMPVRSVLKHSAFRKARNA